MGRTARRAPREIRELAIAATEIMIASHGYDGVSARRIAQEIGYSAGTLYNCFDDLEALYWEVERRHLEALQVKLERTTLNETGEAAVHMLAHAYLRYAVGNPRLWNLVARHRTNGEAGAPPWYTAQFDRFVRCFDDALASLMLDPHDRNETAKALWAATHGLAALSTSEKLPNVTPAGADMLVDRIVSSMLRVRGTAVPARSARQSAGTTLSAARSAGRRCSTTRSSPA